jgi:hypothetical protein
MPPALTISNMRVFGCQAFVVGAQSSIAATAEFADIRHQICQGSDKFRQIEPSGYRARQ